MKLKISVLTAASAVTLLLATLASLAKADTVSYPSRDAGFVYSRGYAPSESSYPSRDAGFIYSRGYAPSESSYPSRDAEFIYSRGYAPKHFLSAYDK
ncbi:cuticle protein [Streptococcus agalactiae]|uniref:cuticle protein n=1 Tax=Streptococcus agalactiae TaxID=1311 RepID=UPI003F9BAF65